MTCINCSAEGEGKYCSNCGQRLEVKRLTWKEGWHDFWARIYGFDGMFPRTFKDLTLRPGYASLEFIRGNRARYYGPVGYFFLMITCFLLLLSIIGLNFVDYMKAMQEAMPFKQDESDLSRNTRNLVADNIKLVAFLSIPLQAFCGRYLFFRKQGMNFLEHSVLPFYVTGHWYWFQMLEAVVFRFTSFSIGAVIQGVLTALYMGFGYTSMVTNQPKWKVFLKGAAVYFVSFLFFMMLVFIVFLVIILILTLIDPSSLDAIKPSKNK
ncbi:MAG TPA: DUF3667 domain-containing protein [Cyclobacteriaceae bacterium]|nr:DUF3667 domain-containing protein [Cyclobacteriaceae bacterium]